MNLNTTNAIILKDNLSTHFGLNFDMSITSTHRQELEKKTHQRKKTTKELDATVFKQFKKTERQRQIPQMIEQRESKGQGLRCKVHCGRYQ